MRRVLYHEDIPLETALASLELFDTTDATHDAEGTARMLDTLANRFLAETADFTTMSISRKADVLIQWMWKQGFTGTPPDRYRALKNVFVGLTLRTVRTGIPLTLVAIFVGLSRRIGLTAHPCAYPGHVYAIVVDESGEHLFYDIFNEKTDPRIQREVITARIPSLATQQSILAPSNNRDLVLRMAQNILATLRLPSIDRIQHNHGYPHVCENSILYAALTAIIILGSGRVSPEIIRHMMQQIPSDFPMDVRFLEEEVVPRVADEKEREFLGNMCNALRAADAESKAVSRRDTRENRAVMVPYYPSECFLCHAHFANLALRAFGPYDVESVERSLIRLEV